MLENKFRKAAFQLNVFRTYVCARKEKFIINSFKSFVYEITKLIKAQCSA